MGSGPFGSVPAPLYSLSVALCQENPHGAKREAEDDRGEQTAEPTGTQSPERRHTPAACEEAPAGQGARSGARSASPQQPRSELDSDVSDDSDLELDIEDSEDGFTVTRQF